MQQRSKPRECLLILDSSSSNIIHVTKDELNQKSPGKGIPGIQYTHKTDDHAFWKTKAFYNCECHNVKLWFGDVLWWWQKERERDIRPFGIRGSTVCTNSIVWLSQQLLQLAHCGCLKSPKSIIDFTPFCTHLVTCNVLLSCLQQFHLTHLWLYFETDPSKNTF